jgi:hypothetical protein
MGLAMGRDAGCVSFFSSPARFTAGKGGNHHGFCFSFFLSMPFLRRRLAAAFASEGPEGKREKEKRVARHRSPAVKRTGLEKKGKRLSLLA